MEIRNRESSIKSGLESVSTQKSIANFKQDFLFYFILFFTEQFCNGASSVTYQRMITITLCWAIMT